MSKHVNPDRCDPKREDEAPQPIRWQLCTYSLERSKAVHRYGLAKLRHGFNGHDVFFIIDAETGEKILDCWDYDLIYGIGLFGIEVPA